MYTKDENLLSQRPIRPGQLQALLICFFLLALDGFDVLAIAFAAPGISDEWDLTKGTLGWVMIMELIGMAAGSIFMGRMADSFGRRPILLFNVSLMTLGMLASCYAHDVFSLSIYRILTGIGIGAVLACSNAIVAELSNAKRRNLFLVLTTSGYAIGAIIGGLISAELLKVYNWRAIFMLGAICTGISLVFIYLGLPESISFILNKAPQNALARVNKSLKKLGHPPITELPLRPNTNVENGLSALFSKQQIQFTILIAIAFITNISTFYFILKWMPKIIVDLNFSAVGGSYVLVSANIGGVAGVLSLALLTQIFDVRKIVITFLLLGSLSVASIGFADQGFETLAVTTVIAAFFIQSATSGMYPLMAEYFPPHIRAVGTGFVLGIGRGGAIAGPIIAGYLLETELPLSIVTCLIATGSFIACIAILSFTKIAHPLSKAQSN